MCAEFPSSLASTQCNAENLLAQKRFRDTMLCLHVGVPVFTLNFLASYVQKAQSHRRAKLPQMVFRAFPAKIVSTDA